MRESTIPAMQGVTMTKEISNPINLFQDWYKTAGGARFRRKLIRTIYPPAIVHQPDAMTLATVGADGRPSARIVLFKGLTRDGFTFFTNYESRKSGDLLANPYGAIVFHWQMPERQVRIEGKISQLTPEESDAYWVTRPRGSQIGAWASDQSRPVASAEELEKRVREETARFEGKSVPRPPHWGGFRIDPVRMEFWEARVFRLHDRIVFTRTADGWNQIRLAP